MNNQRPQTYEDHLADAGMTPGAMERYIARRELAYALRQTVPYRLVHRLVATLAARLCRP